MEVANNPKVNLPAGMLDRASRTRDLYARHLAAFETYWSEEHLAREHRRAIEAMLREEMQTAACPGKRPGRPPVDLLERLNGPTTLEEREREEAERKKEVVVDLDLTRESQERRGGGEQECVR
jgi:hypothetical protein